MSPPRLSFGSRPVLAALLAGGKGTRFWPASRAARPKQFLKLVGGRSLLRQTWERFARLLPPERILVVASPLYAEKILAEIPELDPAALVLEPSGRDTAPAAGLAVRAAQERFEDPVLVVAPTDHFIRDEARFGEALGSAVAAAGEGALVTFGIVPDRPASVYGYIEVASPIRGAVGSQSVLRFHEKPDGTTAAQFLSTGRFYWNAGIFVWRTSAFERALGAANPSLSEALTALPAPLPAAARNAGGAVAARFAPGFLEAWETLPSISIDYALMEKAEDVRVVPLEAGWNDVGGWDAARELLPADEDGNRAAESVLYLRSRDCSVHREGMEPHQRFYALVGTEGLVVVETDDAVLICREGVEETLREVVRKLRADGREDLL